MDISSHHFQNTLSQPRDDRSRHRRRRSRARRCDSASSTPITGPLPVLLTSRRPSTCVGRSTQRAHLNSHGSPIKGSLSSFAMAEAPRPRIVVGTCSPWRPAPPVLDDQGPHSTSQRSTAKHTRLHLDLSRVAIRGWSFGGYLSALAVMRRPDAFMLSPEHQSPNGAGTTLTTLSDISESGGR